MPPVHYRVIVQVTATQGGANLDFGRESHEFDLPEGKDDQDVFNVINDVLHPWVSSTN